MWALEALGLLALPLLVARFLIEFASRSGLGVFLSSVFQCSAGIPRFLDQAAHQNMSGHKDKADEAEDRAHPHHVGKSNIRYQHEQE